MPEQMRISGIICSNKSETAIVIMLTSYLYLHPSSSRQDYTKVYRYSVRVCERESVCMLRVCVKEREEIERAGEHAWCVHVHGEH